MADDALRAALVEHLRRMPAEERRALLADAESVPSAAAASTVAPSLTRVWAAGVRALAAAAAAAPATAAGSDAHDALFARFEARLRTTGYFEGVQPGDAEYARRRALARAKFDARYTRAPAVAPPAPAPAPAAAPAPAEPADAAALYAEAAELIGATGRAPGPEAGPPLAPDTRAALQRAERLLTRALEGDGSSADVARARLMRANARLELGDAAGALADARAGAEAAPPGSALRIRCLIRLGCAHERAGRHRAAIEEGYDLALEIDAANARVREYRDAAAARHNQGAAKAGAEPSGLDLSQLDMADLAAALADGTVRAPAGGSAETDVDGAMNDPEVLSMASAMASQLMADPALLAQMAAFLPGAAGAGGRVAPAGSAPPVDVVVDDLMDGVRPAADGPSRARGDEAQAGSTAKITADNQPRSSRRPANAGDADEQASPSPPAGGAAVDSLD